MIFQKIENFDFAGAAAIATVLLVVSLIVIVAARRPAAPGGPPWLARAARGSCSARSSSLYVGVLVLVPLFVVT